MENSLTAPRKKWHKKWWGILLIIILVFIISFVLAFSIYVYKLVKYMKSGEFSEYANYSQFSLPKDRETIDKIEGQPKYNWLGSADPKVTIVEFGDYACPMCEKMFPKIREISRQYDKDVKIIYRDFPVVTEYSANLSMAARCAGEQGLFWVMHDKLFLNQGVSRDSEIFELANQIGANAQEFKDCYNNKEYLTKIQKDYVDGEDLGVSGTPTLFINGQKIAGDVPCDILIKIIKFVTSAK